jgi:hypothetical protein
MPRAITRAELISSTEADKELQEVKRMIIDAKVHGAFKLMRNELTTSKNGLVMRGNRFVIFINKWCAYHMEAFNAEAECPPEDKSEEQDEDSEAEDDVDAPIAQTFCQARYRANQLRTWAAANANLFDKF